MVEAEESPVVISMGHGAHYVGVAVLFQDDQVSDNESVRRRKGKSDIADRRARELFARRGRTCSVFDVASSSGRRSSMFESIREL